jgi:hypothetical protein
MKQWIGMAGVLLLAACGGRETTASKSAAAYREAQAKGVAVTGGHEHGGHDAAPAVDHSAHAGMDHSTHAAMDHGAHEAMDHSAHAAMDHSAHKAMDHSTHAAMDHSAHTAVDHSNHATMTMDHSGHAAMDHSAMTSTDHAAMGPGTAANAHAGHEQASAPAAAPQAHAGHGAMQHAPAPAPVPQPAAPRSSAEMARMQPAATLQPDDFDAPAATSVSEAQRAAGTGDVRKDQR